MIMGKKINDEDDWILMTRRVSDNVDYDKDKDDETDDVHKKKITLFILGFWSSCEANFSEFDKYTAQLKTPTDRRQTSWLFTKRG